MTTKAERLNALDARVEVLPRNDREGTRELARAYLEELGKVPADVAQDLAFLFDRIEDGAALLDEEARRWASKNGKPVPRISFTDGTPGA